METLGSKVTQDSILNNSNTNCDLWTACVSVDKAFHIPVLILKLCIEAAFIFPRIIKERVES